MYIMCAMFVQRFEPRGRSCTNFHIFNFITTNQNQDIIQQDMNFKIEHNFNPFTPHPPPPTHCKISRLKSVHISACKYWTLFLMVL